MTTRRVQEQVDIGRLFIEILDKIGIEINAGPQVRLNCSEAAIVCEGDACRLEPELQSPSICILSGNSTSMAPQHIDIFDLSGRVRHMLLAPHLLSSSWFDPTYHSSYEIEFLAQLGDFGGAAKAVTLINETGILEQLGRSIVLIGAYCAMSLLGVRSFSMDGRQMDVPAHGSEELSHLEVVEQVAREEEAREAAPPAVEQNNVSQAPRHRLTRHANRMAEDGRTAHHPIR